MANHGVLSRFSVPPLNLPKPETWAGESPKINPAVFSDYGLELNPSLSLSAAFHSTKEVMRELLALSKKEGCPSVGKLLSALTTEVNSSKDGMFNQIGQRGKSEKAGMCRKTYNLCIKFLNTTELLKSSSKRKRCPKTGQRRKAAHLITFPAFRKNLIAKAKEKFNAAARKLKQCVSKEKHESVIVTHEVLSFKDATGEIIKNSKSASASPSKPHNFIKKKPSGKPLSQMCAELIEATS